MAEVTRAVVLGLINRVLEVPGCVVPHGPAEAIEECPSCNELADVLIADLSDLGIVVVDERGR